MAFRNIEVVLYDGTVKISYLDKPHMYFARDRVNWDLAESDKEAWGSARRPKGTTTLIEDTLEKKGLLQWPKGLALGELFGYYNFTNEAGDKMQGFSKNDDGSLKGSLWMPGTHMLGNLSDDDLAPLVKSASDAWQRKKQKGADIGSCVHDAIEHYITGKPYNVLDAYTGSVMAAEYETNAEKDTAVQNIPEDVQQAEMALKQFKKWWDSHQPKLLGAEELIYSKEFDVAGTYDAYIELDGKRIIADWKTSNASTSRDAAAPQGVYYNYFLQSAIYALAWEEMHAKVWNGKGRTVIEYDLAFAVQDLAIVSCRKDGNFDIILASEVGLSMKDCLDWAKAVIACYRFRETSRKALWERGKEAGLVK